MAQKQNDISEITEVKWHAGNMAHKQNDTKANYN
jgi:hypothetical protein